MQLAVQASATWYNVNDDDACRYKWFTKIVSRVNDNCTGCVDVRGHDDMHDDEEVRHPLDDGARTQAYPSLHIPTPHSSTHSQYAPRKCIELHLLNTLFLFRMIIEFVTGKILIVT